MCPSLAVMGGGGDGGDADGDGSAGGGGGGGAGKGGGKNGAPDPNKYPKTGQGGEPVDVITGRMYTLPRVDLALPGPLPFVFSRVYSSTMADRDVGLGHGWAHSLGWRVEPIRRGVRVWNEQGVAVDFDKVAVGGEVLGPWGWVLRRETWGYLVDADDGLWRAFSELAGGGKEHLLTAIQDRCGNRIGLTYDAGRLVEAKDSVGRVIRFLPAKDGRIGSVELRNAVAQGRWVAFGLYAYDPEGNLVSATDADGFAERFAYDDGHLMTLHVDRVGLAFHYVYDRERRCTETWGDYLGKPDPSLAEGLAATLADGVTPAKGVYHVRIAYLPDGYREVANSRQVQQYFGNEHGLVDKVADGGQVVSATYDERGHLLSETDAVGATTRYERDARGRVTRVVDPLGRETTLVRDRLGLVTRAADPAGGATEIARDPRGLPVATRNPLGAVKRYVHDERALLVEAHDALGGVRRFQRDHHGNVVRMVEQGGGAWQWTYDFLGRCLSLTAPTGATLWYRYSERGDLTAKAAPDGGVTHYRYDGERNLVERTDPAGRSVNLSWGGLRALCGRTDENGQRLRLRYDREGDLLEVEDGRGERHHFARDLRGNVVEERTFDGRRLRYRHDPTGRLIRLESASGEVTERAYNAAGELTLRALDDGGVESFTYDARGLVASVEAPGVALAFERDALGRIVREQQSVEGADFTVDVRYDAAGRRVARRTSRGHAVEIARDAVGDVRRLVLDGAEALDFARDGLGRETARVLAGGGRVDSVFDVAGRLARRTASRAPGSVSVGAGEPGWIGETPLAITADKVFRYDPLGDLVETWDKGRGRVRYEHDPAGRLLSVLAEAAPDEAFDYDAADNLFEKGAAAAERQYGAGNRLLRRGDTTYEWDADGRLTTRSRVTASGAVEAWRYRWNARGLLQRVERPDGLVVEFRYDAFARRVEKRLLRSSAPGAPLQMVSTTRFHWDRHVPVHEVTTRPEQGPDPVVEERTYVFQEGSFAPLAQRDHEAPWLHHVNDQLGTPERLINACGDVVAELRLGAWGNTLEEKGDARTPLRFQGQYADAETGLCYNRFRYYDPEIGRFLSPDPIGLAGGLNLFARGVNPTGEVDPTGRETFTPAGLDDEARNGALAAARARFNARQDLVNARANLAVAPNSAKCEIVAAEAKAKGVGGTELSVTGPDQDGVPTQVGQAHSMTYDQNGQGQPVTKAWTDHFVNKDPTNPQGVVDVDQGFAWNSRQDMVDGMFTKPVDIGVAS